MTGEQLIRQFKRGDLNGRYAISACGRWIARWNGSAWIPLAKKSKNTASIWYWCKFRKLRPPDTTEWKEVL